MLLDYTVYTAVYAPIAPGTVGNGRHLRQAQCRIKKSVLCAHDTYINKQVLPNALIIVTTPIEPTAIIAVSQIVRESNRRRCDGTPLYRQLFYVHGTYDVYVKRKAVVRMSNRTLRQWYFIFPSSATSNPVSREPRR